MAASEQTNMLYLGHFTIAASEHPALFPSETHCHGHLRTSSHVVPQRHIAMAASEHPTMFPVRDTLPWLPQNTPPCSPVTPHHGRLRVPHVVPQRHTTMSPFSYTPPWLPQCPFMSLFSDDPPWPPHGVPPRPLPATRSCSPLRSNQHCLFIKVSTAFAFSQPSAISPDGRCL